MFERRLKYFLLLLLLGTCMLMVRAVQVQVVQHAYWTERASGLLQTMQTTETTRGRIFDVHGKDGKVLAIDVPCTDACVDYRAIMDPPSPERANDPQYLERLKWIANLASIRLRDQLGKEFRKIPLDQQKTLRSLEERKVEADIEAMWAKLAALYRPADDDTGIDPRQAIEEIRHGIIQRVEMRRRWVWYRAFQINKTKASEAPQWQKWLTGGTNDGPDIDNFAVTVADQKDAHVVLHALDPEAINTLGKAMDHLPGLVLRPSTHRVYPQKEAACHLLGRLSRVSAKDIEEARLDKLDETRAYEPNDEIGREGVEALAEPLLRGARGKIERRVGDDAIVEQHEFVPGQDVSITIDADLQAESQDLLKHVRQKRGDEFITKEPGMNMHGAIVVIDIKTGEVRALASNPDFDLNELDDHYATLVADKLNNPLVNRATCDEFEPGSTVKPMVGLGAITQHIIEPTTGIECTGYLILDSGGKKIREPIGRCWMASEYTAAGLAEATKNWPHPITSVAHHPIPVPHHGHDGNPDGWLTYSDAIERSCNVFFETVADHLGPVNLASWYDKFGFGRATGIGIFERRGLRPGQRSVDPIFARMTNCFGGIGQGQVWATPLQIANEAATIARNGVWMRPRLLTTETQARLDAVHPPSPDAPPDKVDLHLDPEGLRQAKIGMIAVVNGEAGTGAAARRADMLVAGKTGTAQAARIWQTLYDQNGNKIREPLPPANEAHPVTGTEWYRSTDDDGKNVVHAWFMGFAPAENPEIAFCVLIEYGGSGGGGGVAGPVVDKLLDACEKHGYLHPQPPQLPMAAGQ